MENKKFDYDIHTMEELEAMDLNEIRALVNVYRSILRDVRREKEESYNYRYSIDTDGNRISTREYRVLIDKEIEELEKVQDTTKTVYMKKQEEQKEIERQERKMRNKKAALGTGIGIIVIGIIVYTLAGLTFVKVGDYGIAIDKFNGNVVELKDAGFYWNEPISHKIMKTSVREHTGDIMDGKNDYATDQANTEDNVQLTYNFKIIWKFEDPKEFFNKKYNLKESEAIEIIRQEETKALDRVSNKYSYDFIKSNVAQIGEEVTKEINVGLDQYGLKVSSFSIVGFSAPESVEKKIQEKVSKQQEAEASKYEIEKAQNEAKAQKIKQDATSKQQQQIELCNKAIDKGQADNPACYFGDGSYVTAQSKTA